MHTPIHGLDVNQALPDILKSNGVPPDLLRFKMEITEDHVGQPQLQVILEWKEVDATTGVRWAELTKRRIGQMLRLECDGGCGRVEPAEKLLLFGRCEHQICSECMKKAKEDEAFALVKKCPTAECRDAGEETTGSEKGQLLNELVSVKIVLVEDRLKKSYRTEWYGSQSIDSVRQLIAGMGSKTLSSLSACSGPLVYKKQLQTVDPQADRLTDLLDHGHSTITFVAVYE